MFYFVYLECNKMDFCEEILKDEKRFLRSENIKKLGEFAEIIFSFAKDLEHLYFGVKGKERRNSDGLLEVPDTEKYRNKAVSRITQIRRGYKSLKKRIADETETKRIDAECQTVVETLEKKPCLFSDASTQTLLVNERPKSPVKQISGALSSGEDTAKSEGSNRLTSSRGRTSAYRGTLRLVRSSFSITL